MNHNKINESGYNEASKFGPSDNNPPMYMFDKKYDLKGEEFIKPISSTYSIKNKVMNQIYEQIKRECQLPVALLTYTYKDFDGVLHPFSSITISFRDSDEINIEKMEKIKNKYGEFFMFFNNSTEGKEFWKNNPITIIQKK